VAQLDSALDFGSSGCGFESRHGCKHNYFFFLKKRKKKIINKKYIQKPMARFELATLCLQGRCTNHCATSAIKYNIKTINIIIIFFFFYIFLLAFKIQKKKKKQNKTKNIICLEWDSNPRIRR
jgi:hypothetical protein